MGSVNPINMLVDALARGAGLIHDITTARQIMRVLTMAEKHKLPPEVVAAGMPSSESFWRHEQARGHRPMLASVFAGFLSLCYCVQSGAMVLRWVGPWTRIISLPLGGLMCFRRVGIAFRRFLLLSPIVVLRGCSWFSLGRDPRCLVFPRSSIFASWETVVSGLSGLQNRMSRRMSAGLCVSGVNTRFPGPRCTVMCFRCCGGRASAFFCPSYFGGYLSGGVPGVPRGGGKFLN